MALATDQAEPKSRPKVVGLMYVMLLFSTIASALTYGMLLKDFSPGRLIQVIQGTAVVTILLNAVSLWKQEPLRRAKEGEAPASEPTFQKSWSSYMQGDQAFRRLLVVGLGTMAFGMQDILLEPYGGEILHLTVSSTTFLTATLAAGGLPGFGLACIS